MQKKYFMTNPLGSWLAENGLICFLVPGHTDSLSFLHWGMDQRIHDHGATADDPHGYGMAAGVAAICRAIGNFTHVRKLYIMFAELQMRQIVAAASGEGPRRVMAVFSGHGWKR